MRYNVRLQVEGIEIAGEGAAADTEGMTLAVTPGLVRAQAACGRFQPKTAGPTNIFKKRQKKPDLVLPTQPAVAGTRSPHC